MNIKYDSNAAVAFLQQWAPEGPWQLHAMCPERKSKPITVWTANIDQCRAFIEKYNGKKNIYFTVNTVKRGEGRKKTDITHMQGLHLDLDPPKAEGRDLEADRAEIYGLLTDNLPEDVPPPSFIIDSGGGYWGLWKFKQPKTTNADLEGVPEKELMDTITELERYNIWLEEKFGEPYADNCFNIDRICRLVGTENIPDAKKRASGRTNRIAALVNRNDICYSANDFGKGEPRIVGGTATNVSSGDTAKEADLSNITKLESLSKLPRECADWLAGLIETGIHPEDPKRYDGGKDRSGALYAAVCELVRSGVEDGTIYGIITDRRWKISASVLDKKNVKRYATRQIEKAHANSRTPWLKDWNDDYCIIQASGAGCKVLEEVWDPATKGFELVFHSFEDLKKSNMHRLTEVPTFDKDGNPNGVEFKPTSDLWLKHPRANRRKKVVFVPGKDLDDDPQLEGKYYNLWRGFAVHLEEGKNHQSFLKHLRENVCSGNEEHYEYLVNWMARGVQLPHKPGEAAIVMRGGKGTGKTFTAKTYSRLFGPRHARTISNPKHLTGNFNAHLQSTVFIFADEAFFAGDKAHEGVLKTLVTGDSLAIERKGHDLQEQPNYLHVMMASNSDWVVPASGDERRYLVLDVGEDQKQNVSYFKKIIKDLNDNGYEHLLHYLMNKNIENFKVREIPYSEALQEQKIMSMAPEQAWWLSRLQDAEITANAGEWKEKIPLQELVDDYVAYCVKFKRPFMKSSQALASFLLRLHPRTVKRKERYTSEYFDDSTGTMRNKTKQGAVYYLGTLPELRHDWDQMFGGSIEWEDAEPLQGELDGENEEPF